MILGSKILLVYDIPEIIQESATNAQRILE